MEEEEKGTLIMATAIKTFDVEEGSTPEMQYKITVRFKGKVVDTFLYDRMDLCLRAFENAGYKRLAWTEGQRIVLQD